VVQNEGGQAMKRPVGEVDVMDVFSCLLRKERDGFLGDPERMEILYQKILAEIRQNLR